MIKTMVVSSLEKVGLGKEPVPFKEGTSLTVCRGETASFQIAFIDGNAGENTGISVKKVLYEKWRRRRYRDSGTGSSPGSCPAGAACHVPVQL